MKTYIIKIWSDKKNCTRYLYKLRPTRFTNNKALCLKMAEGEAKQASKWLKFIDISHEIIQIN